MEKSNFMEARIYRRCCCCWGGENEIVAYLPRKRVERCVLLYVYIYRRGRGFGSLCI